jgi:hypothetical protein
MTIHDFYRLPQSRRKKYRELAKTMREEKFKESMNILSLVLNGTFAFED